MLKVNGKEITNDNKKYIQDDDCHWYVIHKDDENIFYELLEKIIEEDYVGPSLSIFESKFNEGQTGGSMDLLDEQISN